MYCGDEGGAVRALSGTDWSDEWHRQNLSSGTVLAYAGRTICERSEKQSVVVQSLIIGQINSAVVTCVRRVMNLQIYRRFWIAHGCQCCRDDEQCHHWGRYSGMNCWCAKWWIVGTHQAHGLEVIVCGWPRLERWCTSGVCKAKGGSHSNKELGDERTHRFEGFVGDKITIIRLGGSVELLWTSWVYKLNEAIDIKKQVSVKQCINRVMQKIACVIFRSRKWEAGI